MADPINWATILLGGIGGALTGGFVNITIGSTKAEREEKGKRRIQVREDLAQAVQEFRFHFSNARLLRLEDQGVNEKDLVGTAVNLGVVARKACRVLPAFERRLTMRRVGKLIGEELLVVGQVRPAGSPQATDAATVIAVARFRSEPGERILGLVRGDPLSPDWDRFMGQVDRFGKRYA